MKTTKKLVMLALEAEARCEFDQFGVKIFYGGCCLHYVCGTALKVSDIDHTITYDFFTPSNDELFQPLEEALYLLETFTASFLDLDKTQISSFSKFITKA